MKHNIYEPRNFLIALLSLVLFASDSYALARCYRERQVCQAAIELLQEFDCMADGSEPPNTVECLTAKCTALAACLQLAMCMDSGVPTKSRNNFADAMCQPQAQSLDASLDVQAN